MGGAALGLIRHEAIGERLRVESGVAVSISADPDAVLHSGGALDLTPLRGLQISPAQTFFLCAQNGFTVERLGGLRWTLTQSAAFECERKEGCADLSPTALRAAGQRRAFS